MVQQTVIRMVKLPADAAIFLFCVSSKLEPQAFREHKHMINYTTNATFFKNEQGISSILTCIVLFVLKYYVTAYALLVRCTVHPFPRKLNTGAKV